MQRVVNSLIIATVEVGGWILTPGLVQIAPFLGLNASQKFAWIQFGKIFIHAAICVKLFIYYSTSSEYRSAIRAVFLQKRKITKIEEVEIDSKTVKITLFGLIANSFALYAVYRFKHLHNTFGVLCAVLAIVNFGDSLIHLVWSAYGPYLFEERTLIGTPGKIMGQVSLFLLDVKVHAHLFVSINLLFSLMFPFRYHSVDSKAAMTFLFVTFPILFAVIQVTPLFWQNDCYIIYYKDIAVWGYDKTPCNDFYSFYIDFILPVVIFCGIVIMDGIALLTIRKVLRSLSLYDAGFAHKRRIEIGFFVQSVCQMLLSIIVYTSFCFLSGYATEDWTLFATTTLAWALLHALDGGIMVVFQLRKVRNRTQTTSVQANSTNVQSGVVKFSHGRGQTKTVAVN